MIRSHPIASRAVNPCRRIRLSAMSVPVRPSPARQCTATTPAAASAMRWNRATTAGGGGVQSSK